MTDKTAQNKLFLGLLDSFLSLPHKIRVMKDYPKSCKALNLLILADQVKKPGVYHICVINRILCKQKNWRYVSPWRARPDPCGCVANRNGFSRCDCQFGQTGVDSRTGHPGYRSSGATHRTLQTVKNKKQREKSSSNLEKPKAYQARDFHSVLSPRK